MSGKILLVTGANGLLGAKITELAAGRFQVVATDMQPAYRVDVPGVKYIQADITDKKQCEALGAAYPDYVIHTAAYTNVDNCEKEREKAYEVNVKGTKNIASLCVQSESKMIHLSSDYVFDGKSGPYTENDITNPVSYYGKTKLESEIKAASIIDNLIIARTTVLYGFSSGARKNFVTWVVEQLSANNSINVVADQFGNPTLADDLAEACLLLCTADLHGVYNTVGSTWISRYEFALEIASVFDLDRSLINKVITSDLKQQAERPLKGGLLTEKLERDTGFCFSSARKGLEKIKQQMINYHK
ncbi:dTDP-4-dehydrorhamnose reductase [bacterium]|nr:dTDP-4-dehydrorhamnose reductase [bacterium]